MVCVSSAHLNYYECYLFTVDCNCFPSVEQEHGGGGGVVWSATSVLRNHFLSLSRMSFEERMMIGSKSEKKEQAITPKM